MYKTIKISRGNTGWGGPLVITPTEKCHTVLSAYSRRRESKRTRTATGDGNARLFRFIRSGIRSYHLPLMRACRLQ